jgi:hypothetical protein
MWPNLRHYTTIFLKGLSTTMMNLSGDNLSSGQHLNPAVPQNGAGMVGNQL